MLKELADFFKKRIKSLEILYVLEGVKPCTRIIVKEDDLDKTREFLKQFGLCIETSDFKISMDKDLNKGGYSNMAVKVNSDSNFKGDFLVYVAKDKETAEKAKQYERSNDYKNLGLMLGYPECCCDFFKENFNEQSKKDNDYVIPALTNSKGIVFPYENNTMGRYFDYGLISHFPCSYNCQKSREIGQKHLEVIKKHSQQTADDTLKNLKSVGIYSDFSGIYLLLDYTLMDTEVRFNDIKCTTQGRLFEDLKEFKGLIVIDKHHIKIKDFTIGDNNFGVMVFE